MNTFSAFYKRVIWFYQCLGVAPSRLSLSQSASSPVVPWLVPSFTVIIYWVALIYSLITKDTNTDLISTVSNYIQILLNALAFSVIILVTPSKTQAFKGIMEEIDKIDDEFRGLGNTIPERQQRMVFSVGLGVFCLITIAVNFYDIIWTRAPILYWIVHAIPPVIYGLCLQQAIFIVYCTLVRCRMVNDLLVKRKIVRKVVVPKTNQPSPVQRVKGDVIKTVYQLTSGIHNLCDRINSFFGPSLLLSLMAMFAVTSIQVFYCYKVSSNFDAERNRTVWTLFVSINIVMQNLLLVTVLCFISDMVGTEASNIGIGVRNLDDDQVVQYSSWLHPVLVNIKISAFGFFNLNCMFLCGFLSALITYLLILIQCNEITGDAKSELNQYNGAYEKSPASKPSPNTFSYNSHESYNAAG